MDGPPDDPEDWSDEQWTEWLNATDEGPQDHSHGHVRAFAPGLSSPGGVVLGAAMMGMHHAIFGDVPKPEIVVEADADGRDDGMRIDLNRDDPSASTVVVGGDSRSS